MTISLVITTFRTGAVLGECLTAGIAATGVAEVIVVDNGNHRPETALLDALERNKAIRLIRGQGNVGFARACNMGAEAATGDVLVFVNPDAVLEADAPSQLAAALLTAPPPAVMGGDLRDQAGQPERGSRRERLTSWRALVSVTGLSRFERWVPSLRDYNRHNDPLPIETMRVACISGALFAMRKIDYDTIGGLDEGYFLHVDDIDICRRAEQLGWPVIFVTGPHGVHVRSTSDVKSSVIVGHKMRGFARYFQKFGENPVERGVGRVVYALLSRAPLH